MSKPIWKPTREQLAFIRKYALDCTCERRVKIEPGIRVGIVDGEHETHMNEYRFQYAEGETDLWSLARWDEFKKGVEIWEDCVEVDFYVYSVGGDWQSLITNVGVHYDSTTQEMYVFGTGTSRKYFKPNA